MPSSQSPNGNQTIIPIDLETLKYSRNLPFFKSNGEIPGKKIPQKMNSVNARIEACVYTKFKLDLKIVGPANIVSRQTIL